MTLALEIPGGSTAPSQARDAVGERCDGLLSGEGRENLRLILAELVTNAITHGRAGEGERVLVRLELLPELLRIEVLDHGPGFEPAPPQPGPEGGWGLFIVNRLAKDWGVTRRESTTSVWFEMITQPR